VPPTYGEPGAAALINNVLINSNYGAEVFSLNNMLPGDMVGWNWEGNTSITVIDHDTVYLGNGLLAAHANSRLDVPFSWYVESEPGCVYHLIHIYNVPGVPDLQPAGQIVPSSADNATGAPSQPAKTSLKSSGAAAPP
jgi:hypothetical protein